MVDFVLFFEELKLNSYLCYSVYGIIVILCIGEGRVFFVFNVDYL